MMGAGVDGDAGVIRVARLRLSMERPQDSRSLGIAERPHVAILATLSCMFLPGVNRPPAVQCWHDRANPPPYQAINAMRILHR